MIAHPVIWAKLLAIGAVVFVLLLGLAAGLYQCFLVSPALGVAVTVAVVIAVPTGLALTVKYLPRTAWGRGLQLGSPRTGVGEGTPAARKERALVGKTAVAETPLRPSGVIRIDGERIVVTAEGEFVQKGTAVQVIKAVGMNVVVRKMKEA